MSEQDKEKGLMPLKVEFTCKIVKKKDSWTDEAFIEVNFKETVPPKEDPVKYIKRRIAEEINRQQSTFDAYMGLQKEKIELDPLLTSN